MQKKFVIMTVGKTHSGKTTFACRVNDFFPDSFVLDSDVISMFLRENFPLIHLSPINREIGHNFDFNKPQLQYGIFKTILSFSLKNGFNAILSNSNTRKEARKDLIKFVRKYGIKVIMVYFNISEEILIERIKKANKSTAVLNSSKDFYVLLEKQRKIFEPPDKKEADYFFEIKDEEDISKVLKNIKRYY
ncbi:MAG: ATP-binding protein [bacterium]